MDYLERLRIRKKLGNFRQIPPPLSQIDFCSNDYLGLSKSEKMKTLFVEECSKASSLGSTGSRLLTGNSEYAERLERKIASFHGFPSGLLIGSGYLGNLALASLPGKNDRVFFDIDIHASIRNGLQLSKALCFPFRHNDLDHLEKKLQASLKACHRWIYVESVYSVDGSSAPLEDLCQLAKHYQAHLIVDEAHAVGVFGSLGEGLVAEKNLCKEVFAILVTFGKALGCYGAIILGSSLLMDVLINFSPSCIYTTALPLFNLIAINSAYELLPELKRERAELHRSIKRFKDFHETGSNTPIQSILCRGNEEAKKRSQKLLEARIHVKPLLSPTVRRGKESLRICLHSYNTDLEIQKLITCIKTF